MNIVIRISFAILLVTELVVGFWNRVIPTNFYNNFPTVDATLPTASTWRATLAAPRSASPFFSQSTSCCGEPCS